jgi:hypothetical protein
MLEKARIGKLRGVILVGIALIMGANLLSPAVAHVTRRLNHLFRHLDPRYVNVGEAATNSNALGGTPASGFLKTADIRVDGAVTDTYLFPFTSTAFTSIQSKSFTAPSDGFLFIVGSVSWESSTDPASMQFRLRLDSTPITSDPFAYMADVEGTESQESGSASAVVPVTAGAHTVHLDAAMFAGQAFIIGRDVSILFAKSGSGVTPPVRHQRGAPATDIPAAR